VGYPGAFALAGLGALGLALWARTGIPVKGKPAAAG